MPRYRITADDLPFAREFLARPVGYHSPGLQRVLNLLRGEGPGGKYVVVVRERHRRWSLGQLPARRGEPVALLEDLEFTDLLEAEREVFRRRWRAAGGPDLGDL